MCIRDRSDSVRGTNEGSPLDNAQVKLEHEMQIKLEEATQNNQLNLLQEDQHLSSLTDWKLNEILKSGKVLLASSINDYNVLGRADDNVRKQTKADDIKQEIPTYNAFDKANENKNSANKKSARMLAMARRKKKMIAKNTSKHPVDITESSVSKTLLNEKNMTSTAASSSTSPTSAQPNPKLEITEQANDNKPVSYTHLDVYKRQG